MLVYSAIASLDLYTADAEGKFDWAEPDEEVFAFVNDLERGTGTYLYGRRMYETMASWETSGRRSPTTHRRFCNGCSILTNPGSRSRRFRCSASIRPWR